MTRLKRIPKVSVVIRVRNEARWIRRVLHSVQRQKGVETEVLLVDNESGDDTVSIAESMGNVKVLQISRYSPGRALNLGVREAIHPVVVFLSGHCVPRDDNWLLSLVAPLSLDDEVVASYGRQVAFPFSPAAVKTELSAVFRSEPRIQSQDDFIHNANSAYRRHFLLEFPFDEDVKNLEDRLMGSLIISQGLRIAYQPEAAVYHDDGFHREGTRANQTPSAEILETRVQRTSLSPFYRSTLAQSILPVLVTQSESESRVAARIEELRESLDNPCLREIECLRTVDGRVKDETGGQLSESHRVSLDNVLAKLVENLKSRDEVPDFILFFTDNYPAPGLEKVNRLVQAVTVDHYDSSFFASIENSNIWFKSDTEYVPIQHGLRVREEKVPIFRANYGFGTILRVSLIAETGTAAFGKAGVLVAND